MKLYLMGLGLMAALQGSVTTAWEISDWGKPSGHLPVLAGGMWILAALFALIGSRTLLVAVPSFCALSVACGGYLTIAAMLGQAECLGIALLCLAGALIAAVPSAGTSS